MLIALSTCLFAALAGRQTPALDHSAEPTLKQLFVEAGSMRQVHLKIELYYRNYLGQFWNGYSSANLWLGSGGRFRYVNSADLQGGGLTMVSDGLSFLSDDMTDNSPITISPAKKSLSETTDQEIALYFCDGQTGFDALVDEAKPITFIGTRNPPDRAFDIHSKTQGHLYIHWPEGSKYPTRIEFDNAPWWPEGEGPYPGQPFTREDIRIADSGPQNPSLFKINLPKNKPVVDQRPHNI